MSRGLRAARLLFFLLLIGGAIGGFLYMDNRARTAENGQATAVAEKNTAVAGQQASDAQAQRMRQQQQAAQGLPTETPIVISVPGPLATVIVVQTSSEYSYVPAVTTEPSPSKSRIRFSVVVPPRTKADELAFRLEGGTDQPIGLSATTIDAQPGQYYTAHLVKKSDANNGPVLGSTGQFQVGGDQTVVIVFTFVPKESPATPTP